MTPYLNEDYENMHTKKDVVLVNMWPFGGMGMGMGLGLGLPWRQRERKRRLERGMVVLFRWVSLLCKLVLPLYRYLLLPCFAATLLARFRW